MGIGIGFVATAGVLWRAVGDIAADVRQVDAYTGQFLISVVIISLSLPVVVTTIRRGLPADVVIPYRLDPVEPFRRQMLTILTGLPVLVALGWLSVALSRMPLAELGGPLLAAVALITCLIPLGFAIVTGWRRFFVMTGLVVGFGLLLGRLVSLFPDSSLFMLSLFIWAFTGILFVATGAYQLLNFWRHYKRKGISYEAV